MSAALDGIGDVTSREYPREALTLARRRLSFEHRLNVEERLDAHNVLAWRMCELGDLEDAISTSERGLAALQPGQDPFFALAVASWRPYAMAILGRWDDLPAAAERCRQLWLEGQRPAAGYAVSAFVSALDVARARQSDGVERWSAVLDEILGQFEEGHPTRRLQGFVAPDVDALTNVITSWRSYVQRVQHVERALAACADRGKRVPTEPLDEIIERDDGFLDAVKMVYFAPVAQWPAVERRALRWVRGRVLEAGLVVRVVLPGQVDLASSLSLFQEIGARPYAGRVEIELGELTGDRNLSERGLVALDALGDVDQLERVRERIARPTP